MNAEAWKKHFVDMAEGKFRAKSFYQLSTQRGGSDVSPIQLVTPTQQAIEMAHSQAKQRRKTTHPTTNRKVKQVTKRKKKKIRSRVLKKTVHSKKK
jgi:hypothetical protein